MISQTKFSNIKENAAFYINDESELFIKASESTYFSQAVRFNIDPNTLVFADDFQMIEKPVKETIKRTHVLW